MGQFLFFQRHILTKKIILSTPSPSPGIRYRTCHLNIVMNMINNSGRVTDSVQAYQRRCSNRLLLALKIEQGSLFRLVTRMIFLVDMKEHNEQSNSKLLAVLHDQFVIQMVMVAQLFSIQYAVQNQTIFRSYLPRITSA